ncbi:MAG: M20/M25/M40 family metallo-hydrolase [Bacillota bacterium]|nr:M20/M25/M40 family metallo-hydrolase [Bacillota bacterium]
MELLKKLAGLNCISGFEYLDSGRLKYILDCLCDEVSEDSMGNLRGYIRCGDKNAPLIMLNAHYDMIGMIVSEIKENGFVRFDCVGGVDDRILPGQEVILHGTKDIYGIIGLRPIHILTNDELKKPETRKTLAIDTGMDSEKLREIIKIGTPVSLRGKVVSLGEDFVSAPALDDRAGCHVVLRAVEGIKKENLKADICVMLSTGEELGRRGGSTGAYDVNPDMAVVVDATFGKTPESDAYNTSQMGEGPIICKGPSLSRAYVKQIIDIAEKYEIPYQVEVEGGDTGTDAFVIGTAGEGIPCVMVSFPLKYMHTGIETVSCTDLENATAILRRFILDFSEVEYA